jgi:hypothetical protein
MQDELSIPTQLTEWQTLGYTYCGIGRYDREAHVQRFVLQWPARWPEPGALSKRISNLGAAII